MSGSRDAGKLAVEFLGDRRDLADGDDLTFGRAADLEVDDNQFMHRLVGRFVCREGVWWVQNLGTRSRLELLDVDSGTLVELAPGQQLPIVARTFVVRFTAGPTSYELNGVRSGEPLRADAAGEVVGTATVDFGDVPLSPEQHLLVVGRRQHAHGHLPIRQLDILRYLVKHFSLHQPLVVRGVRHSRIIVAKLQNQLQVLPADLVGRSADVHAIRTDRTALGVEATGGIQPAGFSLRIAVDTLGLRRGLFLLVAGSYQEYDEQHWCNAHGESD